MAVLKKEDLIKKITTLIGEDTSDDSISLLEDVTDTIEDLAKKEGVSASTEWETKYKEMEEKYNNLDKEWREKYKARFSQPVEPKTDGASHINGAEDTGSDDSEPESFEDLFTESEV